MKCTFLQEVSCMCNRPTKEGCMEYTLEELKRIEINRVLENAKPEIERAIGDINTDVVYTIMNKYIKEE